MKIYVLLTLMCEDLLFVLLAEICMRTGWTMLWTKWRIAVRSRQRFLQICWNLFSASIPVRPVWRARTKKRTAETLATDLSSSCSAASTTWSRERDKLHFRIRTLDTNTV